MSEWQKANLDADFIIPSRELVVKRDEERVQAYIKICDFVREQGIAIGEGMYKGVRTTC